MRTEAKFALGSKITRSRSNILELALNHSNDSIKSLVITLLYCVILHLGYCIVHLSAFYRTDAATVVLAASNRAQWAPPLPPSPPVFLTATQPYLAKVAPEVYANQYPNANFQAHYQPRSPLRVERNLQQAERIRYAPVIGDARSRFIDPAAENACSGRTLQATFCLDSLRGLSGPLAAPLTRQQATLALDRPRLPELASGPSSMQARANHKPSGSERQPARHVSLAPVPQYSAASSQVLVQQGGFLQKFNYASKTDDDVRDNEAANSSQAEQQQRQVQHRLRRPLERSSLHKALMGLQNPLLLGGDILLRTGKSRRAPGRVYKYERSALVSPIHLWPNAIIYYELDPSVLHLSELIYKVMQQFHDETCIRFIERQAHEPDYLRIEALRGCFSYIGRIGGEQTLSLGDGCEYRGTIAHELLHAVGFYHHQNRSDRDDFLEILWDNIAKGKESQFSKMAPDENILLNDFDYQSIMLYGPRTFGKTLDKITMRPKRGGVILLEVIEKLGLSSLDVDSVNKLYKCSQHQQPYTFTS